MLVIVPFGMMTVALLAESQGSTLGRLSNLGHVASHET